MWYDADLSKKQATEEPRGTEEAGIAPQKRSSVCTWYKALISPWVATIPVLCQTELLEISICCLAEMPPSQLSSFIFSCGGNNQWGSVPSWSSSSLELNGGLVYPLVQGGLTAPAGLGTLTFIETKCNQPATCFSSEKPHVRQACLLPRARGTGQQLWWAGSVPTLSKKKSPQNRVFLCPIMIANTVVLATAGNLQTSTSQIFSG